MPVTLTENEEVQFNQLPQLWNYLSDEQKTKFCQWLVENHADMIDQIGHRLELFDPSYAS
jgi:hypothetical protein